jgi:uncharacterized membrane protein YhaH (DUF805 family)
MTNNSGNFTSDGRISRETYWHIIGIHTILWVLSLLVYFVSLIVLRGWWVGTLISNGFQLALLWWFLAYGAKRCHDLGNSGFYQLIPFYFLFMLFQEGDVGDNFYGQNPNNKWDPNPIAGGKDMVEKVKWYRKAADQGDAAAQCRLGACYANGTGVAKDEVEAVKWYREAADQGYASGQTNLAVCYYTGTGVPKDEVESYAYWSIAGITNGNIRTNLPNLEKNLSPEDRLRGQQRFEELQKEIEAKIAAKQAVSKPPLP